MKNITSWVTGAILLLLVTPVQVMGSQAGGLPALAERVAALEAAVAELNDGAGYVGDYHTTIFEIGSFGCNTTNDPATVLPGGLVGYLQAQGISSQSVRSGTTTAEADGSSLYVPEYSELTQELRLSGTYEEEIAPEGNFTATIEADGSLTLNAGPDVDVTGHMSANGDAFTLQAAGHFQEDGCEDTFTLIMIGNRI